MEYSRRPTKSIPKENQLKILNKIYQTYLVSTTDIMKKYTSSNSNIRRTLVDNIIVDHSDEVAASPVGAAPTTSSFST